MPYLPVELDAINIAPDLARAAGLSDDAALAGLLRMWAWVFRVKSDRLTLPQLAGFFGGDTTRLPPALVAFGFLLADGDGWRLTEFMSDRLLSTHRQRVQAGRARAASGKRSAGGQLKRRTSGPPAADQRATSGGPALTPSTQHLAPEKKLAGAAPAGPPDGADATYKALVAALFTLFREHKGVDYEPSGRDWKALAELRSRHEGGEIVRRWGIGLQARYGARCATFWALRERWNDCAQPEASSPQRAPNGAATAADKDWT